MANLIDDWSNDFDRGMRDGGAWLVNEGVGDGDEVVDQWQPKKDLEKFQQQGYTNLEPGQGNQ